MLNKSIFQCTLNRFLTIAVAIVAATQAAPFAQSVPAPTGAVLTIAGDIPQTLTFTLAELKAMPRTKIAVQESGKTVNYEGVLVSELLTRAKAPAGRGGMALTSYVRAKASDDYEVVFSVGELDQALAAADIIVADIADGHALFDYQGPLRLVVPHDKRGARSVRMLTRLDIVAVKK